MRLLFTQSAQQDLVRLREFIAKNDPQAAGRVSQRLLTSIRRLRDQPRMGINVEDLPGVQDFVAGNYVVRYTVLEDEIFILRIWHGREDRFQS